MSTPFTHAAGSRVFTGRTNIGSDLVADAFELPRAALAVVAFWAVVLAGFLDGSLEDFLRVFLDIRLPFVAFRGSINRVLRVTPRAVGFAPAAGQV